MKRSGGGQSLTAYVGVDGTSPSLNSARLQNQPQAAGRPRDRVNAVAERLQTAVARVCRGLNFTCSQFRI